MEKKIAKTDNVFLFGTEVETIAKGVEKFISETYLDAVVIRLDDKLVGDFLKVREQQQEGGKQQPTVEEYVANEDNRALAAEKAMLLWNIMTENADVANASKRIFQKSEVIKKTTLTHKTLNELLELLSLFGFIEYPNDVKYEFRMVFTPQVRLTTLHADMIEAISKLNSAIVCYKSAIDTTDEIKEKDKQKAEIKAVVEQLIKY